MRNSFIFNSLVYTVHIVNTIDYTLQIDSFSNFTLGPHMQSICLSGQMLNYAREDTAKHLFSSVQTLMHHMHTHTHTHFKCI